MGFVQGIQIMKSLAEYILEAEADNNYSVGDAFDFEFGESLCIETVIVELVEDGVVVSIDNRGIDLLVENNLQIEEKARDEYNKDVDGDHVGEGYEIPLHHYLPKNRSKLLFSTI